MGGADRATPVGARVAVRVGRRVDAPEGNAPEGNTPGGNTPQGNTPQGNAPQGNAPQGRRWAAAAPAEAPPGVEGVETDLGRVAPAAAGLAPAQGHPTRAGRQGSPADRGRGGVPSRGGGAIDGGLPDSLSAPLSLPTSSGARPWRRQGGAPGLAPTKRQCRRRGPSPQHVLRPAAGRIHCQGAAQRARERHQSEGHAAAPTMALTRIWDMAALCLTVKYAEDGASSDAFFQGFSSSFPIPVLALGLAPLSVSYDCVCNCKTTFSFLR